MKSGCARQQIDGQRDLTEQEFQRIAEIAKLGWGLKLDRAKSPLIFSRLIRRLSELRLDCFAKYCEIVESGSKVETDFFVSALTTNVTSFYRELHHFKYIESRILPRLMRDKKNGERIRFWSAGCSSGQEAYSLAGSVLSVCPKLSNIDVKILATDIDQEILEKARAGRYQDYEIKFSDRNAIPRIFNIKDSHSNMVHHVRSELQELIEFRYLNLMEAWPFSGRFDIIMCRNVAIYFDKDTQQNLWSRFSRFLEPGGYLFVGHSERISNPQDYQLSANGTTAYRKMDV